MIRFFLAAALALFAFSALPHAASAAPEIGKAAPDFTGTDSNGQAHKLSDYKGRIVVLEWTNHECPFVKKQYESGNMQKLQEDYTGKDVVWLSVVSSAKGKQGYTTPEEAGKIIAEKGAKATARILDHSGEIGRLYDARTTPHMFVVDKDGILAYEGAIDDNDSTKPEDALTAKNYVRAALDALIAGKKVKTAQTKPYGCSVKY